MGSFGIKVSKKGVDANEAKPSELLLSSLPLPLLDTQNPVSFVNTDIFFASDPPNPDGMTTFLTTTEIYSFKHGYDYIPQTWFLFQNSNPIYPYGDESVGIVKIVNFATFATFSVQIDATEIRFYINKGFLDGIGDPVADISGFTLRVRSYVFAGELKS